jgi:photosystem II stability/assembly factor-like uncharacterized protein
VFAACGRIGFDAGSFSPIALPSGGRITDVALAADGTLYAAGCNVYMLRSNDNGASWMRCGGAFEIERITVSPTGAVLAAGDNGVWQSDDRCATWRDLALDQPASIVVAAGPRLLAGTYAGLYSYDGATWSAPQLAGVKVIDIAVSPGLDHIYAATGGYNVVGNGIACSSDGGQTFAYCNNGVSGLTATYVVVDSANGNRAYAQVFGAGFQLYRTIDGGASWTVSDANGGAMVAVDPADDTFISWASWGAGLEASYNGGTTYDGLDHRSASMFSTLMQRMAYAPGSQLYAATDRGLFAAADHRLLWAELDVGIDAWEIDQIVVGPSGVIYLATPAGVLRSIDHGATWSEEVQGFGSLSETSGLAQSPVSASTIYTATTNSLMRSDDQGQTFTPIYSPGPVANYHVLRVHVLGPNTIVATTEGGVAVSTDGSTFRHTSLDGALDYTHDVLALDASATQLVAVSDVGVFVSSDSGGSWSSTGLTGVGANCIAQLGSSLVVGTNLGVYSASSPMGPWTPSGLDGIEIDGLFVANGRLLAGTVGGVFVSDDGATWQPVRGLETEYPTTFAIDTNGDLLVGTYGHGLFRAPVP